MASEIEKQILAAQEFANKPTGYSPMMSSADLTGAFQPEVNPFLSALTGASAGIQTAAQMPVTGGGLAGPLLAAIPAMMQAQKSTQELANQAKYNTQLKVFAPALAETLEKEFGARNVGNMTMGQFLQIKPLVDSALGSRKNKVTSQHAKAISLFLKKSGAIDAEDMGQLTEALVDMDLDSATNLAEMLMAQSGLTKRQTMQIEAREKFQRIDFTNKKQLQQLKSDFNASGDKDNFINDLRIALVNKYYTPEQIGSIVKQIVGNTPATQAQEQNTISFD